MSDATQKNTYAYVFAKPGFRARWLVVTLAAIMLTVALHHTYCRSSAISQIVKNVNSSKAYMPITFKASPSELPHFGVRVVRPQALSPLAPQIALWIFPWDSVESIYPEYPLKRQAIGGKSDVPKSLSLFPELRFLSLSPWRATDQDMSLVGQFAQLEVLDISNSEVTDSGISRMGNCHKLIKVYVSGTRVTMCGVENFLINSQLEYLVAENTQIDERGMTSLMLLPEMRFLFASHSKVAAVPKWRSGFVRLESLELSGCPLDPQGALPLTGYESIVELKLQETSIDNSLIDVFLGMKRLKYLDISHTKISGKEIVNLAMHPSLQKLVIKGIELDGRSLISLLSRSKTLQVVVSDKVVEHATLLPAFETIGWEPEGDLFLRTGGMPISRSRMGM